MYKTSYTWKKFLLTNEMNYVMLELDIKSFDGDYWDPRGRQSAEIRTCAKQPIASVTQFLWPYCAAFLAPDTMPLSYSAAFSFTFLLAMWVTLNCLHWQTLPDLELCSPSLWLWIAFPMNDYTVQQSPGLGSIFLRIQWAWFTIDFCQSIFL